MSYIEALERNGSYAAHIYNIDSYSDKIRTVFCTPFEFRSKQDAEDHAEYVAQLNGIQTHLPELELIPDDYSIKDY